MANILQELPEFLPMGESYSLVMFPSRFFLDSEPALLSQIITHLHTELTETFGVTLLKLIWEKKVSVISQVTEHLSGTEGCPGPWNFQSLNEESPSKLEWLVTLQQTGIVSLKICPDPTVVFPLETGVACMPHRYLPSGCNLQKSHFLCFQSFLERQTCDVSGFAN